MRKYKTKAFHRWAKDSNLSDGALIDTINEMNQGNIDTNCGGNVYKQRFALPGRGKRGGARTIVAFKVKDKAIFLYGFAKNSRANIKNSELESLKKLAKVYLEMPNDKLNQAVEIGELLEIIQ